MKSITGTLTMLGMVASVKAQISQEDLDSVASTMSVYYGVVTNGFPGFGPGSTFEGNIVLSAGLDQSIPANGWDIYFSNIRNVRGLTNDAPFNLTHIQGDIFKLSPTDRFAGLSPGESVEIRYQGDAWMVAITDGMPNWSLTSTVQGELLTSTIASTSNRVNGSVPVYPQDELPFVGNFDVPEKWKRGSDDLYDPYTAEVLYQRNADLYLLDLENENPVIPTPNEVVMGVGVVDFNDGEWSVVFDEALEKQATFLASTLRIRMEAVTASTTATTDDLRATLDNLPTTEDLLAATTERKLQSPNDPDPEVGVGDGEGRGGGIGGVPPGGGCQHRVRRTHCNGQRRRVLRRTVIAPAETRDSRAQHCYHGQSALRIPRVFDGR